MSTATGTTSGPASTWWPLGLRLTWWVALTGVLALGDLLIGVTSPIPHIRWAALVAGALILGALIWGARAYRLALVALVAGAVVPAAVTWWSLITPVTAVLVVACGVPALRSRRRPQSDTHERRTPDGQDLPARPRS